MLDKHLQPSHSLFTTQKQIIHKASQQNPTKNDQKWKGMQQYFCQFCIQLYKMHSAQLLSHAWRVWFSVSSGTKSQTTYTNNLIKLHQLNTWADFAYIWTQSEIANSALFFANPQTGQFNKFEIGGEMRKVESINFFKGDIEPTWEYGDNSNGGYFNFSLSKQTPLETVQRIYELIVFMALGSSLEVCQSIFGVRIIDVSSKKKFRCRFQIWVDYQDSDDNLLKIKKHATEISQMLIKNEILLNDIKFFNIGGKNQQPEKPKENEKNQQTDKKV